MSIVSKTNIDNYVSKCCGAPIEFWGMNTQTNQRVYSPHCGICSWDTIFLSPSQKELQDYTRDVKIIHISAVEVAKEKSPAITPNYVNVRFYIKVKVIFDGKTYQKSITIKPDYETYEKAFSDMLNWMRITFHHIEILKEWADQKITEDAYSTRLLKLEEEAAPMRLKNRSY